MKSIVTAFIFTLIAFASGAQVVDKVAGESFTYYDSLSRKKVKEIFHHKEVVLILPDPKNYGEYIDSFTYVKNGAYMKYDEAGKLQCQGYYREDKQDGLWTWYDPNGKVTKTVKFVNGKPAK